MLCKTCCYMYSHFYPQRNQGFVGWQLASVLYLHLTINDPAISPASADQCLLGDLFLDPIQETCYCTCTARTAGSSGAFASRSYCKQPCCRAELCPVCRSCALSEWTPWRHCQAHVPCMPAARLTAGQQGLLRIAFSACTASLSDCSCHLPCMYMICLLNNQQHQTADKAASLANDVIQQPAD